VAVLLNGLGSVKYEELFVLWSAVLPLLEAAGLDIVAPEVGELVTSLDMAGCSLTLSWLDDELERLWLAPADSPAFRRTLPAALDATPVPVGASLPAVVASTEVGRQAGVCVKQAVEAVAALLRDLEDELGRLDAVAGDGDHGRGMARGSSAALAGAITASDAGGDAPTVLRNAGEEWADKAGGTSGALWGAGLLAAAERLPSDAVPTDADVVAAVVNAWQQVKAIGGAEVGDKTLVDALEPFAVTLQERFDAGDDLETAWTAAVSAAQSGAASTSDIAARMGRSRVLGAKSLGSPDPGATSLAAVMAALAPIVTRRHASSPA
jgi:dihydroxyacetone kinase